MASYRRLGRLGSVAAVAGVVLAGQAVTAAPAGAVGAFGSPTTIVPLPAGCDTIAADVTASETGVVSGFAQPFGEAAPCGDPRIQFIQRSAGGTWTRTFSPYQGILVGSTVDGAGTYLLWQAADGLRLARKAHGGAFGVSRLLSPAANQPLDGSVIATGGTWWAVWSEGSNPTPSQFRSNLYQAKTYGTDLGRTPVAGRGAEREPALALRPGGGAVLVWTRGTAGQDTAPTTIWVASSLDGSWISRSISLTGDDSGPVIATNRGGTYIAWSRRCSPGSVDTFAVERDNRGGSFSLHAFPGDCVSGPNFSRLAGIAASSPNQIDNPKVNLATSLLGPNQPGDFVNVNVKERNANLAWSQATVPGTSGEMAVDIVSYRGKATLLTTGPAGLRARTQS
jgi:hypothetical protein